MSNAALVQSPCQSCPLREIVTEDGISSFRCKRFGYTNDPACDKVAGHANTAAQREREYDDLTPILDVCLPFNWRRQGQVQVNATAARHAEDRKAWAKECQRVANLLGFKNPLQFSMIDPATFAARCEKAVKVFVPTNPGKATVTFQPFYAERTDIRDGLFNLGQDANPGVAVRMIILDAELSGQPIDLTADQLDALPTISVGSTADLKLVTSWFRIWRAREDDTVTVERKVEGEDRWVVSRTYTAR